MRELHLAYLCRERARYIRAYARRDCIITRDFARRQALLFARLIRKFGGSHERA